MLLLKDTKQIVFHKVLAHRVEKWSCSLVFTFSAQTSSDFVLTLLSQAMLINELFGNDSEYILTSKFQSAPTERRFSVKDEWWPISTWPLRGHKFRKNFILQSTNQTR